MVSFRVLKQIAPAIQSRIAGAICFKRKRFKFLHNQMKSTQCYFLSLPVRLNRQVRHLK